MSESNDRLPATSNEGLQNLFESSKQLTTLNAGSIVVIGTFLKDIFPHDKGGLTVSLGLKILIAGAFLLFGTSLVLAVYALYWTSAKIYYKETEVGNFALGMVSFYAFVLALLCFGTAVVINLF